MYREKDDGWVTTAWPWLVGDAAAFEGRRERRCYDGRPEVMIDNRIEVEVVTRSRLDVTNLFICRRPLGGIVKTI